MEKIQLRKLKELSLLFEISRTLDASLDLDQAIQPVLELLKKHMSMERSTITLLNRQTGLIMIESACDLSDEERRLGIYRLGEGITGGVVKTGKPMVIADITRDRRFLDKTGTRKHGKGPIAFICVPVTAGKEIMGALSADRPVSSSEDDYVLEEDVRLLSIVASMIAQALRLRRSVQEDKQKLLDENSRLKNELEKRFHPKNIVGNSTAMQEVFDLMAQISKSDATILIRGENGTGKELIAHAIHYNSLRASGPFIKVNCAALPESVIESELFGHEKGAFTGAVQERKGRFELAAQGSIFLDEIGDLTPSVQIKLLRVLQEREFERVGATDTRKADVRIITATNRNLEELIVQGKFREDLYYRLNVFPIHIPPLRDRQSDIMLLADYFTEKYSRKNGKEIKRISTPAIELLSIYHWPGNVRELENCIERAVLLSSDGVIHGHHLPPTLQSAESTDTRLHSSLEEALDKVEKELLLDSLKSTKGNSSQAARILGISERIMGLRIKKYDINSKRFRV